MELKFQISASHKCDFSKENQLLMPCFAEMLTLQYRPLQIYFNSSALSVQWT